MLLATHTHCKKCSIIFDTAEYQPHYYYGDYSTPTVPYNTPLVWYAHFVFYSVQLYELLKACMFDALLYEHELSAAWLMNLLKRVHIYS